MGHGDRLDHGDLGCRDVDTCVYTHGESCTDRIGGFGRSDGYCCDGFDEVFRFLAQPYGFFNGYTESDGDLVD